MDAPESAHRQVERAHQTLRERQQPGQTPTPQPSATATMQPIPNRAERRRMERAQKQTQPTAAVEEIAAALEILCEPGAWHELRTLNGNGRPAASGYFNDREAMAKAAFRLNQRGDNVYFTLNPVLEELSARSLNHTVDRPKHAAADDQIISRRWLLVDIDPVRISGISSTDEEHDAALALAEKIRHWLMEERNWPAPIVMDSGNGAYLLWAIALPNDETAEQLVTAVLQALARRFDDNKVKIDTSTFNASRIARVPGTVNAKGDDTPNRPHRMARLLDITSELCPVRLVQLQQVASEAATESSHAQPPTSASPELQAVLDAIVQRSITVNEPTRYKNGLKYILSACLFNPDHGGTSVAIIEYASGAKQYSCLHGECKDKKWGDVLRELRLNRPSSASAGATVRTPIMMDAPVAPALDRSGLYGPAGRVVDAIYPHSEANEASLLLHFLVGAGNLLGRSAYFVVENTWHHTNLYYVCVGDTAKGRKGTTWGRVRALLALLDPAWAEAGIRSGLSSGEGLISAVADNKDETQANRCLLVVQTEFAGTLKIINRDGNTLSAVLREFWDTGNADIMVKQNPLQAHNAHVSVIGHITADEFRRTLTATEQANGFTNRFLLGYSARSKCLPEGGNLSDKDLKSLADELRIAIEWGKNAWLIKRTPEAAELWAEVYPELSAGDLGLLGAITSRAEAQVLRLSMIYCLLDKKELIEPAHLQAALAVWDYCKKTAKYIWGDALGDPIADAILAGLRQVGDQGMTRTAVSELLGRHSSATQITVALTFLESRGYAHRQTRPDTGGRPAEIWRFGPRHEQATDTVQ